MQPGWDWCHGCGFDPEHLKPLDWTPEPTPAAPPAAPPVTSWPPHDVFAPAGSVAAGRSSGPAVRQVLTVLLVVAIGVAAIGGVAWVVIGRDEGGGTATSSTVATLPPPVELVTATGPDGSYTVGLPGTPVGPETLPAADPGQLLLGWFDDNAFDPAASRGYLVISQALPGHATRADQLRGLDAMAARFASDPSASTIETTLRGFPARRFAMTLESRPSSGIAVVTDDHVFLLLSTGPNPTDERQAVEDSFRLTTP
ncbi:MAG: hypothetical protein ACXWCM_07155 [Acidimicrobiales bacterium]